MTFLAALADLGSFVVKFQSLEAHVLELIVELTRADREYVHALITELDYSSRLRAVDVIYARYVEITAGADASSPSCFHKLMVELRDLGERRNDLVHSHYGYLATNEDFVGLVRQNRKLRPSKGRQETQSEDLIPGALDADLKRLGNALQELEGFRQRIITWNNPA